MNMLFVSSFLFCFAPALPKCLFVVVPEVPRLLLLWWALASSVRDGYRGGLFWWVQAPCWGTGEVLCSQGLELMALPMQQMDGLWPGYKGQVLVTKGVLAPGLSVTVPQGGGMVAKWFFCVLWGLLDAVGFGSCLPAAAGVGVTCCYVPLPLLTALFVLYL